MEEETTPCVLWTGATINSGYGIRTVKQKNITAHRYAYIQAYGEIPAGKLIRHKCDTKLCVNPKHMELGTQKENLIDAMKRGQIKLKFTDEQILDIRSDTYHTGKELGIAYGTDKNTINRIRRGASYKHV